MSHDEELAGMVQTMEKSYDMHRNLIRDFVDARHDEGVVFSVS